MRIRTLLITVVSLSILMVAGLTITSWLIMLKLTEISAVQTRAQTATREVSALLILTHEYALYGEDRAAQQWKIHQANIVSLLEAGADEALAVPHETLAQARSLVGLFKQLEEVTNTTSEERLKIRRQKLLLDKLLTNIQILADAVHHWGHTTSASSQGSERAFHLMALLTPVVMLLILLVLAMLLVRRVLHPLSKLHEAVIAVAQGNFTVRSASTAKDEFGELSRTFDAMAVDLVRELKQEIVERKQAEAKLAASEMHLRTIIENEPECIKTIDADGRLIHMNPAGLAMIEADSLAQVAGRPVLDIIAPEYRKDYAVLQARVLAGEAVQMEYEVLGLKGGRRWLETHAVPMQDEGGRIHLAVTRDISGRKRAENALKALNDTLEQRVQEGIAKNQVQEQLLIQQSRMAVMGEMIGNIAHQWRQPLNALALLLANIKDANDFHELDTATINDATAKGQELIVKMSATIDDFRNFFKPNKEKKCFHPWDSIEETIKLISQTFRNNNIEIQLDKSGEACKAIGYPNEFSQVVLNLLSNAREALMEKAASGKVSIRVEKGKDHVTISVRNTGAPIPEDVLPRIFEPYFTTKEKGTGIGLYMSKMIMEHMAGDIAIHNVEDGVEALLTLPAAPPA